MAKLQLENLQKQYNSQTIPVKDVSLQVNDGEFLTLLGPSGCGKSTLLRLIAGLESISKGNVMIGGKNVNGVSPGDRNIAMVFQSYALYPHMSVEKNIGTSLKLKGIPSREIKVRVGEVAVKLQLESLLHRKPGQLSGGQRQRVALARALVRDPDVFLLDEPLSNLDALLRENVRGELKQLFKYQNKPVVYVTHDQTEAMTLSTKVAVLYDGLIQQLDSPTQIYKFPSNQFVAGFVGSPQMNLLTLKCEGNWAILGDFKMALPNILTKPSEIVMGIRPEDIYLAGDEKESNNQENSHKITGKVDLVEQLGKESLISIRVDGSDFIIRFLVPIDTNPLHEKVCISIPEKAIHWFDVVTGDRLN